MASEKLIVDKLKSQCQHGKEINPKESAKTLHQLGVVYRRKGPNKISLIQSVALMTSAVLRQPDNVDDITKELDDTCLHIFKLANAANPDANLVSKSVAEIKAEIKQFRENTKDKLYRLKPLPDDAKGNELDLLQRQRVEKIKEIQDFVTETYKSIMSLIAGHTIHIMGDPPCKFALLGMGSLAKKEITPYSDFESIIVLEEDIQNHEKYKNILEYFKWFSTVFQIILIRLGETILRFLAIPCLNNALNSVEDWFYDAYTPCGICPDGFAPQASKNPLGRQTKTQKKPWTTELIKPVSEMAKYLDPKEDYLADMLTKTMFVFGTSSIHQQFERKVFKRLGHQATLTEQQNEQLNKDLYKFQITKTNISDKFDVKRMIYRSASLFVEGLGRLYGLTTSTVFAIISDLMKHGYMEQSEFNQLSFMFAISYEIRLRAYNSTSEQNDIRMQKHFNYEPDIMKEFTSVIGTEAVLDCITTCDALRFFLEERQSLIGIKLKQTKLQLVQLPILRASVANTLKLYHYAEKFITECNVLSQTNSILWREWFTIYVDSLRGSEQYNKAVEEINNHLPMLQPLENYLEIIDVLALSLLEMGKYKAALTWFSKISHHNIHGNPPLPKYTVYLGLGDCLKKCKRLKESLENLALANQEIENDKSLGRFSDSYYLVNVHYGVCLNLTGNFAKARTVLEELLSRRRQQNVNEETDVLSRICLFHIGVSLYETKRYTESLEVLEQAWKSKAFRDKFLRDPYIAYFEMRVKCLGRLHRFNEIFDTAAEILDDHPHMLTLLIDIIADFFVTLTLFEQAQKLYKQAINALQTLQQYNTNKNTEKGEIFTINKKINMQINNFQQKIDSLQDKIDNYDVQYHLDKDLENHLQNDIVTRYYHLNRLSDCWCAMGKHGKAVDGWKEILSILPELQSRKLEVFTDGHSHPAGGHLHRSTLYSNIGLELNELGRNNESIVYHKKAFSEGSQVDFLWYHDLNVIGSINLMERFFTLGRYRECLLAAVSGIQICKKVYDNCAVVEMFVQIASVFVDCERALGIEPMHPYHCSPSVFYQVKRRYEDCSKQSENVTIAHYAIKPLSSFMCHYGSLQLENRLQQNLSITNEDFRVFVNYQTTPSLDISFNIADL